MDDLAYHRELICAAMSSSLSVQTFGLFPKNRRQMTLVTLGEKMMSSSDVRLSICKTFIVMG